MLNINRLNQRIHILNDDELVHECWSTVSNLSGIEVVRSNVQFDQATTKFTIRYTKKPLTTDMTIKFNGYLYDIQYINDVNFAHESYEILAIKNGFRDAR